MIPDRLKSFTIFPAFSTIIVSVIFIIAGLSLLPIIPVQLNPNTHLPAITVQFGLRNLPPSEVEQKLTSVIEGALSTIEGVNNVRSQSNAGNGSVTLQFDKYADISAKRHEVVSMIRQIYPTFPANTDFPNITIQGASGERSNDPVIVYTTLTDKNVSSAEAVLNQFVVNDLSKIKNVRSVTLYGMSPEMYEIVYNNGLMQQLDITLNQLSNTINNLNRRIFIGNAIDIKNHFSQKSIVVENRMGEHLKLEDVEILNRNNKLIRIGDFATVRKKNEKPTFYYRINGKNTINVGIVPNEGANQLELSRNVSAEIEKIKHNLPSDYHLFLIMDHTEFIKKEVNKLMWFSILSVVILLSFIFMISRDLRYLLVIFISLLASVSVSFFFYFILGIQLHLFSFAGITISFGMMIDYTIIMIEHLKRNRNMHVFLAILASASTSIISLSAIYFLDDEVRLRLHDFASVIIINLFVSLTSSLLLVPALFEKIRPRSIFDNTLPIKKLRVFISIQKMHQRSIHFVNRYKVILFIIIILSFGLPLFLLPPNIEGDTFWTNLYNQTIGSETYQTKLKEPTEKWLGGALRVFSQKVDHGEYNNEREETTINVMANFPQGTTLEQTNELFGKLENYLSGIKAISFFDTYIMSPQNARMTVFFKKEFVNTEVPLMLENALSRKALELGSADWSISGAGSGFNSNVRERSGSYHLYVYGFSYDELQKYANQVKNIIEQNPRVEGTYISGSYDLFRSNNYEYVMTIDRNKAAWNNTPVRSFIPGLKAFSKNDERMGSFIQNGISNNIFITSSENKQFDIWKMKNNSFTINQSVNKLVNMGTIEKQQALENINKSNQQYQLIIDFDYIGETDEGMNYVEKVARSINKKIPLGFSVETRPQTSQTSTERSNKNSVSQNWLIFYILIAIYFVCAILFNSLLQPFAVIVMIPFTFIGVFLSFYIFGIKFDQGGYASLVLLSGLTVNSAIYFINERNVLIRHCKNKNLTYNDFFFKSFSHKIIPVFLTLTSASLGLTPFLLTGEKESFWFPLAVGTISGLVFSIIAILFFLPLFFLKKQIAPNKITNH